MKTFQVFLGLAVLVLALWATATPVNADGNSLIGGWTTGNGCAPCEDDTYATCAAGGCGFGSTWVCDGYGYGNCTPNGYNECTSIATKCTSSSDSFCSYQ